MQRHETDEDMNEGGDVNRGTVCPDRTLDIFTESSDKENKNKPPETDVKVIHKNKDAFAFLVGETLSRKKQKGPVKKRIVKKGTRRFCWK